MSMPVDLSPRGEAAKGVSSPSSLPQDPCYYGLLIVPPLVTTIRLFAHGMTAGPPVDLVGSILGLVCQWLLFIFPLVKPIDGTYQLLYVLLIFTSFASMLIWPLSQPKGLHRWDGTFEGGVGLLSFPFLYLGLKRFTMRRITQHRSVEELQV